MIKTLNNTIKQDRTAYKIPRSVQDVIPIQRIFADGIFQFGTKYSRTLRFSDINYAIASKEDTIGQHPDLWYVNGKKIIGLVNQPDNQSMFCFLCMEVFTSRTMFKIASISLAEQSSRSSANSP